MTKPLSEHVYTRTVDDQIYTIEKTTWDDGRFSFHVLDHEGNCLTEYDAFDDNPSDEQIRDAKEWYDEENA